MPIREACVIDAVLEEPFEGYARRQSSVIAPDVDRIAALVAVLGTILSGIVLGRSRT